MLQTDDGYVSLPGSLPARQRSTSLAKAPTASLPPGREATERGQFDAEVAFAQARQELSSETSAAVAEETLPSADETGVTFKYNDPMPQPHHVHIMCTQCAHPHHTRTTTALALHMLCTCSAHMLCACSAQRYDVFVSHCKKLGASEDRALWVVDAVRAAGLKPFFDRLDLLEISEEVLKRIPL